jgi:ubiquinone/menaquinone biosynthesis C-methylase UbiE
VTAYREWLLPRLIAWVMRAPDLDGYRGRLVPRARGVVLDLGIGSGLNLPLYGPAVQRVIGLDPSADLLRRAGEAATEASCPVHLLRATAEAIPLRDGSVDTVVMTWTLCSLGDARAGLAEARRVLRPGGELVFVEHGLAPEPVVARWQHRLDPLWVRVSCHLDNPVERLIAEAGFEILEARSGYLGRGPKLLTFMTEGIARTPS